VAIRPPKTTRGNPPTSHHPPPTIHRQVVPGFLGWLVVHENAANGFFIVGHFGHGNANFERAQMAEKAGATVAVSLSYMGVRF